MSLKTIGAIILAIIIGTLYFVCFYDALYAKKQNEINILKLELQKVELQRKIKEAQEQK